MNFKSKIKRRLKKALGRYRHLQVEYSCPKHWYGNTYGGFYACPDRLDHNSIVYSFGIGQDISFDRAIIQAHGARVVGFDPTPKSVDWIASLSLPQAFTFHPFGISEEDGTMDFFLPKNKDHVSGSLIVQQNIDQGRKVSVKMKTLGSITKMLGHQHIDVLKMDIEGSEYGVIEDILQTKIPIHQILIEFHDRFFEDGLQKTKNAIQQLRDHGYVIFAVSDSFEEISFIKK